jgi:hypothetical protein
MSAVWISTCRAPARGSNFSGGDFLLLCIS